MRRIVAWLIPCCTLALALAAPPGFVLAQVPPAARLPAPIPMPDPAPPPHVESYLEADSGWPGVDDFLYPGSRLAVRTDAFFFRQAMRPVDRPVIMNTAGDTLLAAPGINGGVSVMPRLAIEMSLDPSYSWEAVYFGNADGTRTMKFESPNDLMLSPDLSLATLDFYQADQMRMDYSAQMHNFEVNYWTHGQRWSWLAGCRFLKLAESLNIHANDFDTAGSDYRASTWNNMFGGQLGARWARRQGRSGVEVTGKMGVYQNAAGQTSYLADFDNSFVLRDFNGTHHTLAMIADLNASAVFQLTDVWSFRAGYMLMWIENVVMAADQLDFTDTPTSGTTVNNGGGMLFHGAQIGLEARW